MAAFTRIDRVLSSAVGDLHDYLWTGKRLDERKLLARLESAAGALDRHVGARGAVAGGVRPLIRRFNRTTMGADLFTFLETASDLSAAVELSRRNSKQAAKRASGLAVSLSIHLAASVDRFDLVESFESGKTDFAAFTSALADVLEGKGVLRAGEFRRAVNTAFDVNALWDANDARELQRVAVLASISSVGFAACLLVDALRNIGLYREVPFGKLTPAVERILGRLGGHP